jgi:hypothetical protein
MNEINKLIKDKPKLLERISAGLDRELKRQKKAGKKFISDEEVDVLIDQIIKEELGDSWKDQYLYNTFYRGWYYHRDTDGLYYEDHNFQYSSEVVLMSNEIELLCEVFFDNNEAPPCYLVLSFIDNKWVGFIDFYSGSPTQIRNTYKNKELPIARIYSIEIGDYKLDDWELAQQKALDVLTNFIINYI